MIKLFTVCEIENGFILVAHAVDESTVAGEAVNYAFGPDEVELEVKRYFDCFYRDPRKETIQ